MKGKGIIIGGIVAAALVVGIFIVARPKGPGAPAPAAPKAAVVKPGKGVPAAPAKKAISKDMGALTVKMADARGKQLAARIKAFRSVDSRSSVHVASLSAGRMQELAPGTYDIEIETSPVKIYKGINVAKGRETVEDIGRVTGSIEIKALGASKKPAAYPVKVMYPRTGTAVTTASANRPVDVVAGIYDIEIGSSPKQARKDVRIEGGKETVIDIGSAGAILVKAVDETGKETKGSVKIRKAENSEVVATHVLGKQMEILPGTYIVESAVNPSVSKKDVKVDAQEETVVELIIPAPPAPAPKAAAAAGPTAAKPPAAALAGK